MGQTLSHGVYLPNEGERNCYAGLASNWQILNTAVGNIAEKAPLVHTHTVSQITDFPAYGNAAGTICEGNDSRLSDARTPVAHTHTKSDVTDLLNSNFIPSANNSYNLGSSSYQWNNLYAKNYYYNGTAWGLDKANAWSAINSYSAGIKLQGSRTAYILPEFAASYSGLSLLTYNALGSVKIGVFTESNNTPVLDTTKGYLGITTGEVNSANIVRLEPVHGDTADLGTSTNKFKTLNGINPGALSLPDSAASDNINITSWDKRATNGVIGSVTASADGWINIQIQRDVDFAVWVIGTYRQLFRASMQASGKYLLMLMFPINKNRTVNLYTLPLDALESDLSFGVYRFYPCFGNV